MIGETISERYRIDEKLGEGGMGVVYRAFDLRLGRTIALKILRPELAGDVSLQRRLSIEARAASALSHASVATLYDFEQSPGGSFLIYEYIKGRTLRAAQLARPLEFRELLPVYISIAEGMKAAHDSRIVHRDLKPENVMLRDDGQAKILDFGLAKFAGSASTAGATIATAATVPGLLLGTIAYMSPEQLDGEDVDWRSDIFSFGAMLYETASGQHPFNARSSSSTIGNILKEEPFEVSRWTEGSQPGLEPIARKCLRKRKEERYQSAGEILVDLQAVRRETQTSDSRRGSGVAVSSGKDFSLPVEVKIARVLFQLLQVVYLVVYAATMKWGVKAPVLATLVPDVESATLFIVIAAMCGVATRLYLMSAVGWSHPEAGRKFLWLFPWLLLFDGLLWSAAPILLWKDLEWLSLFLVAVMAYLPFAQRTLIRTVYPGVRASRFGRQRSSGH